MQWYVYTYLTVLHAALRVPMIYLCHLQLRRPLFISMVI